MWKRLERWQNNLNVGMTKERYLKICEQTHKEPNPDRCPPGYEDFPEVLQQALEVYNKLGDRVYPDIGYMGKDFTALPLHMKVVGVSNEDLFLEALVRLDAHMIKKSSDELKQARKAAEAKARANAK